MGQKSSTETLFKIVAAFIERATWTQAELARHAETTTETIRKRMGELQEAGFPLERQLDTPHVYWSVPRGWLPGAMAFSAEEAKDVFRVLGRAPSGALRNKVLRLALGRLAGMADVGAFDPSVVQPAGITDDEERWLPLLEDSARERVALKMRYFTASRGKERWRHVSVHRVDVGARPTFVSTCHEAGQLRRFRVANVLDARLDRSEDYRAATKAQLDRHDRESFGGFRDEGPVVRCAFFVRDPEAAWVAKNLPDPSIVQTPAPGGVRFVAETSSVAVLARFVVGLGELARAESDELKREVRLLATAALANAG